MFRRVCRREPQNLYVKSVESQNRIYHIATVWYVHIGTDWRSVSAEIVSHHPTPLMSHQWHLLLWHSRNHTWNPLTVNLWTLLLVSWTHRFLLMWVIVIIKYRVPMPPQSPGFLFKFQDLETPGKW